MESSALLATATVEFTALLNRILAIDKENGTWILRAVLLGLIIFYALIFIGIKCINAKADVLLYVNMGWIALMTLLFVFAEKISLRLKKDKPTSDTEQGAEQGTEQGTGNH